MLRRVRPDVQHLRAESSELLTSARAEADQLRTEARELLASARAEVGALVERRAAIERELGSLSGVIEALAVPESPDSPPDAPPDAPTDVTDSPSEAVDADQHEHQQSTT